MNTTRPKFPKFTKKVRAANADTAGEETSRLGASMPPQMPSSQSATSIVTNERTAYATLSPLTPLPESPSKSSNIQSPQARRVSELRRTHFGKAPDVCGPWDGKVASYGPLSGFVLTSPTELHVPKMPKDVDVINTFLDGRWGVHEYSRHPQWYVEDMTHIACIPRMSSPPSVPDILFVKLCADEHWEEDPSIAVRGIGRINSQVRVDLFNAANTVIDRTTSLDSKDEKVIQYRKFLAMLLRQVITRLNYLPAVASRAIAIAAHVQRLCLELMGMKTYLEVVIPRMESSLDFSRSILDVVGGFLREGAVAQTWHRVGIPFWFLQPLTKDIVVYKVVTESPLPYDLVSSTCDPPILHQRGSFVGVTNLTGNWVSHMVIAMSKHVAGSHLSSLDLVCLPDLSAIVESDRKRIRGEAKEIVSPHLRMRPAEAPLVQSKGGRPRYLPQGAQAERASSSSRDLIHQSTRNSAGTNPTQKPNPSRSFVMSPFIDVSALWVEALLAVSPLPQTPNSALYFFPPPFLLDTVGSQAECPPACVHPDKARVDTKVNRYVHNLLRIRQFCRLRLFDASLENRPLSISEWRAALWGEYSPQTSVRSGGEGSEARRAKRRLEERNAVGTMFHTVANMDIYSPDAVVRYDGCDFDLRSSSADVALRQSLLWESHEINFRAELLSLDTILVQKKDWQEIERWEREMLVSGVWGSPASAATVVVDSQKDTRSFCWYSPPDERWESCRDRLRHFVQVLMRWPDCPQPVIDAGKRDPEEVAFGEVQRQAVEFYVRTFVSQYARLPIPPVESP